jgi:hypothetical protein
VFSKLTRFIDDFKCGTANVIKWFPIIWNDKQWDYHYIYKILYKKFEFIEKHMQSDQCIRSVNQDKYIKQVQVLKYLLNRMINGQYLENALTEYHKKFGDNLDLCGFFEDHPDKPGCKIYVDKRPIAQQKQWQQASKHSDIMRKQDFDYFFYLLKKNIENFWD